MTREEGSQFSHMNMAKMWLSCMHLMFKQVAKLSWGCAWSFVSTMLISTLHVTTTLYLFLLHVQIKTWSPLLTIKNSTRTSHQKCFSTLISLSWINPMMIEPYKPSSIVFHSKLENSKEFLILYINSVSLSICPFVEILKPRSLLIKLSPRTRGPKNYSEPRVFIFYFYFYVRFRVATARGLYFLLLFLRPFLRSNYRRFLLLTFTFTSEFVQQLPSSMGEVFLGFGG